MQPKKDKKKGKRTCWSKLNLLFPRLYLTFFTTRNLSLSSQQKPNMIYQIKERAYLQIVLLVPVPGFPPRWNKDNARKEALSSQCNVAAVKPKLENKQIHASINSNIDLFWLLYHVPFANLSFLISIGTSTSSCYNQNQFKENRKTIKRSPPNI